MASSHSTGSSAPTGLGHFHAPVSQPRTPEPCAEHEKTPESQLQPPSPPRPKFKIKRRIASNLGAPTQQFLASVAAADVPIPSIEEPPAVANNERNNERMPDITYPSFPRLGDMDDSLACRRGRMFSPPRTPAPGNAPSLSPKRFPDWSIESACSSIESTPDCESSRPSTARSTQTSASLFSRYSVTSDDFQELDTNTTEVDEAPKWLSHQVPDEGVDLSTSTSQKVKKRRHGWSKPMSDHLWATYLMYLQDPKITPIRFGKNGVPPHGVCARVAREAKRSWRGPKPQDESLAVPKSRKSGSNTPTGEAAATFVGWWRTCAATRAHLRELCKLKSASAGTRANQYIARSPTPFGRTAARLRNRRTTPTPSAFSKDLNVSLTMSTADSMQPHGPLSQLTQSTPEKLQQPRSGHDLDVPTIGRRRLASPFAVQSYGPSSSSNLDCAVTEDVPKQSQTFGPRRNLQSPVRLTRSRSSTQKRRPKHTSVELRRTKRPSLSSDFWVQPSTPPPQASAATELPPRPEFSSASLSRRDELFVPRTNLAELFSASVPEVSNQKPRPDGQGGLALAPPAGPPPRLGSPFSGSNTSFSFPNRLNKHGHFSVEEPASRLFATVQQSHEGSSSAGPARNLTDRLAYIDERLKQLRQREHNRGRSESPH